MIGDMYYEDVDRWLIPDDRQLALRGKLGTGWSTITEKRQFNNKKTSTRITYEEQEYVVAVLRRNDLIQLQEQYRIGGLVTKLERMKKNIYGDGLATCLICGAKTGFFKDILHFCGKCGTMVCSKCSIESKPPPDGYGKLHLCVLCNEDRMLWKRSGAWFYKSIPKYILIDDVNKNKITSLGMMGGCDSLRSDAYARLNQSVESIEGSEDSDNIEHTHAFEIPENNRLFHHESIITDEDSRSLKSSDSPNMALMRGRAGTNSSTTSSLIANVDATRNEIHRINSATIIGAHPKTDDQENMYHEDRRSDEKTEQESLTGSRDSVIETTGGVFRKMSRQPTNHLAISNGLKTNDVATIPRTNSNSSINSDQDIDIDGMFQSYESEKSEIGKLKEKSEYTGQCGMIKFTMQYDTHTQDLLVIIDSCCGLKLSDKDTVPSPYVNSIILPVLPEAAKATRKHTPTLKKDADPVFNFAIVYPGISLSDIETKGIKLSVMDEPSKGIIGETCVPMKGLCTHPIQQFRRILDPHANVDTLYYDSKKTKTVPGRIELSLQYVSSESKLRIGIIRCVGLRALDPNGYSDPYVKCYLLPDPEKSTKQKTSIKKKTLNPEFNEEFTYDIEHKELAKKTLYLAVWDYDVGRTNDFIGGLALGIDSSGEVLKHWFETLKVADKKVIRWHNLDENCQMIND